MSKQTKQSNYKTEHLPVMLKVLRMKFLQNPELKEALLKTGDAQLIHYAPWGDTYWGVGVDLKGSNKQGVLLMQIREELRNPPFETTDQSITF